VSRCRKAWFFVCYDNAAREKWRVELKGTTESAREAEERVLWCRVDETVGEWWDVEKRKVQSTSEGAQE